MINGPWITNPLVPPDTTPEHTIAGVAPEGVVTASVLPVIDVNLPVLPVIVAPDTWVLNTPDTKLAVVPVVVTPVNDVKLPVVKVDVTPWKVVPVTVVPVITRNVPVVAPIVVAAIFVP
jgi:hypothetical protein